MHLDFDTDLECALATLTRTSPQLERVHHSIYAGARAITSDVNDYVCLVAHCVFGAGGQKGSYNEVVQALLLRGPVALACAGVQVRLFERVRKCMCEWSEDQAHDCRLGPAEAHLLRD